MVSDNRNRINDPATGYASLDDLERALWDGLRPDVIVDVATWSESNRILSGEGASEPGPWRNERTPYLVEIMQSLSPESRVEEVVFMKSAQIGGTECGNNWIAYIVARGLGPTLAVQKSVGLAERYSKQRLDPMFRDTPALEGKVQDRRKRDSGNTILQKAFPGGTLMLSGAEAAAGLRSMPIRNLFLDEIDAYPEDVEGEGDPVKLAERRTMTFTRRKVFKVSTPTHETTSKISRAYRDTDQRRYHVPCPHCGLEQLLEWSRLRYDTDDDGKLVHGTVRYDCAADDCDDPILEHHKRGMLLGGKWIPTADEPTGLRRGYHINALYSPWFPWWKLVVEWLEAKGDVQRLKSFVNTLLGETWKEQGEAPEWRRLYSRRETYREGTVPMDGHLLTAGVDVQRDRLEVEVVAWGPGHESWSIDYHVFNGDPAEAGVWDELEGLLSKTWPHESGGHLRLARLAIDSSDQTQLVYTWARRFPHQVLAIKGVDGQQEILGPPKVFDVNSKGKRRRRGAKLWPVGVSTAKHELYAWLRLPEPVEGETCPRGFCHFPDSRGREWFEQLCAEEWTREKARKTGRWRYYWRKTRERNEALDCRVYARAAAAAVGIDRWEDDDWAASRDAWALDTRSAAQLSSERTRESGSRLRPDGYLSRWQSGGPSS